MSAADDFFDSVTSSPQREVLLLMRRLLRESFPELTEEIKWGKPNYLLGGNSSVCYLAPQTRHVNFGFMRGTHLTDPKGRMEGTGRDLRHIKLHSMDDVDPNYFCGLVAESIALMRGS